MKDTLQLTFTEIIKTAWLDYDNSRPIESIEDYSPRVSTNHVYRINLMEGDHVFAKLSYFGHYDQFKEDHTIIHTLATNLPHPYETFLSKSLMKKNKLYFYEHNGHPKVWVVFYNPIKMRRKLPKKLEIWHIAKLGSELAGFHKACWRIRNVLPNWHRTLRSDIKALLDVLSKNEGDSPLYANAGYIRGQCKVFLDNLQSNSYQHLPSIPVFVDWNIGNFSVTQDLQFYSRWDYDWFRVSSRVMDFYFFSRVVSEGGDRTVFSYTTESLTEDRFVMFLKEYHRIYPLTVPEIKFLREAYRFFILNYVLKHGRHFFHEGYANRLQQEAVDTYLPQADDINTDFLIRALGL